MTPTVVANLALVVALVAAVIAAGAIMMCLYMLGQVATVMKLWGSEAVESDPKDDL